MSMRIFMKVPDIQGESIHAEHEGEIDLLAIDWSMMRELPRGGAARPRMSSEPFRVSKNYDASSPYLAEACRRGKSFDEVIISFRQDTGDRVFLFLVVTLTNVVISSYDIGVSEEGDELVEEAGLSFEEIKVLYTVQSDDHSSGDEHEVEFDIVAGA